MAVPNRYILHQAPVIAALGKTVLSALARRFGGDPRADGSLPGPEITTTVAPLPPALVRDYIRHVGGDPASYRGRLPPHLFPQWGFPLAAQTLAGSSYPLQKVLNAGCRMEIRAPLPSDRPLRVRARLESISPGGCPAHPRLFDWDDGCGPSLHPRCEVVGHPFCGLASRAEGSTMRVIRRPVPSPIAIASGGRGRDVWLIPGAACGPGVWRGLARALEDRARVHRVSLAGFAGQPPATDPLLDAAARELEGRIGAAPQPVTVVAHSLGCYFGYALAAAVPRAVAALVVVDGPPALGDYVAPQGDRAVFEARRQQLARLDAIGLRRYLERAFAGMVRAEDDLRALVAEGSRSDPRVLAEAMYALWTRDLRPELARIEAPVLAVLPGWPGLEPEVRAERMQRYRQQLAAVRELEVTVIEGARHFVMLDAPREFEARVIAFLTRTGALDVA